MGTSCCDPLEVLLFIVVELPRFPRHSSTITTDVGETVPGSLCQQQQRCCCVPVNNQPFLSLQVKSGTCAG